MRVDQIITLVWVGNLALLGSTGYVGWKFWEQKKLGTKVAPVEWPEPKGTTGPFTRWPGPFTAFKAIVDTQVNGLVPPPPPPPNTGPVTPVDIGTSFRNRITIVSAFEGSEPPLTMVKISDSGTEKMISLGQRIDDWKLIDVRIDHALSKARVTFSNPHYEKGPLVIEQDVKAWADPSKTGGFVLPPGEPPFSADRVDRGHLDTQAWNPPGTGDWMVPAPEVYWWERWGEEEIVAKTKFVARPEGVEIASVPPNAALDSTRGLTQGDVIVSINGVAVKTLDDILAYLRGPGRNESRYAVVIERNGARRTTVYRVSR